MIISWRLKIRQLFKLTRIFTAAILLRKKVGSEWKDYVSLVYKYKPYLVVKPLFYVGTSQECCFFFHPFCETLSVDQTVNPSHKHTQSFLWLISVSVLFSVFLPAGSSAPLCLAVSYFIVPVGWLTPAHYEQVTRTRWRWRAMLDHWSLRVKYLVHCGRVGGNRLHKCVFCFAFFFFCNEALLSVFMLHVHVHVSVCVWGRYTLLYSQLGQTCFAVYWFIVA